MHSPRILIVKTSSMGDVIHALPALTDLHAALPSARVDWVVESGFAGIVPLHPAVGRVIRSDLRKWKKAPFAPTTRAAFSAFKSALREHPYDVIVDLQGLVKSAFLARLATGVRAGYDRRSIREPLASYTYHKRFAIGRHLHAVDRNRALLAEACGYPVPATRDYGLRFADVSRKRLLVCCHATSRENKLWPEAHWRELIAYCAAHDVEIGLPWGSADEEARAHRLAAGYSNARVWPRDPFPVLARDLASAACVVGVDTGLVHLAAAVGTPVVGLYVATDPALSGVWGGQAPAVNLGGIGQMPPVTAVIETISPWLARQR